jgi:rhodanese-related sulfurtransferase
MAELETRTWSRLVQQRSRGATPEITVDELDRLLREDGAGLVDVREEWEYRRGRVPGALNVPLSQFAARAATLPRDRRILVICESGHRSLAATEFLIQSGFEGAASVKGGTSAWARSQRPLEKDPV